MENKRRSQIPAEILALVPKGHRVNESSIKGTYQVYTAIDLYDPVTKKKSEKRTYVGKIKNGKFTYTNTYLLKMKDQEIAGLKAKLEAFEKRKVAEPNEVDAKGTKSSQADANKNNVAN